MKEPTRYKLTDAPEIKKVNLTPLPSLQENYPDSMSDDVYIKTLDKINREDNS